MKNLLLKSLAICAMLLIGVNHVSAQGLLNKLKKGLSTESTTNKNDSVENDTVVKALKWDKIPVYTAKKIVLTKSDGTPMLNDDGTPVTRVLLVDQYGNKRSYEAVNAQYEAIEKAVNRIILKVGGGAAVGALSGLALSKGKGKGAAIGAAAGAVGGLALSANDIKEAKAQKKSIKQQKQLIEAYQKCFTAEGTPIDASVDLSNVDGFDFTAGESVSETAEALKAELASETFNSSDESAWSL